MSPPAMRLGLIMTRSRGLNRVMRNNSVDCWVQRVVRALILCTLVAFSDLAQAQLNDRTLLGQVFDSNQKQQYPSLISSTTGCNQSLYFPSSFSYILAGDTANLNPRPETVFVVSFIFRFNQLPPVGYRQNLITKYVSNEQPFPGWGVAIQRYPTSSRPEVYWRSPSGKGGWYTFERFDLLPRKIYGLTMVYTTQKALMLFLENGLELANDSEQGNLTGNSSELKYEGGYRLNEVELPVTGADLIIGSTSGSWRNSFIGEIRAVSVSEVNIEARHLEARKNTEIFRPSSVAADLGNDQVRKLFQVDCGVAESINQKLAFRGDARWQ